MEDGRPNVRYVDRRAVLQLELGPAEQAMVDEVNRRIAATQSLEELVDYLFEATQPFLPCDRIALAFLEDGGERVVSHYVRARYEPLYLKRGYAEDVKAGTLLPVLRAGTPRIIDDLALYLVEHPGSASTKLMLREDIRSSMTCPLIVEGRIVGLMWRSSKRPGAYDAPQARLHLAIAERLSQAVEKALRIEQLAAANLAYTEMLGFVSHELKSPLAGIVTDATLLLDGYLGDLEPKQREKVAKVVSKAEYLLGLIRDYLDLARIESGSLELRAQAGVDFLGDVVRPAVDIVRPQIDENHMTLETVCPGERIEAEVDPELMRIVLVNLLGNAAKYGNEGGRIRLTVERRARQDGGAGTRETAHGNAGAAPGGSTTPVPEAPGGSTTPVPEAPGGSTTLVPEAPGGDVAALHWTLRVTVWNEGPGFPASQRAKLFRRFSRIDTPELKARKGTGVGLYSTWRIIRLHFGRITAASREGEWAEFVFEVPQPLSAGRDELRAAEVSDATGVGAQMVPSSAAAGSESTDAPSTASGGPAAATGRS